MTAPMRIYLANALPLHLIKPTIQNQYVPAPPHPGVMSAVFGGMTWMRAYRVTGTVTV